MRIALFTLLFVLLSGCSGYEVRDDKVYWTYWNEGMGSGETELDVDYETFEILDDDRYAKDRSKVFYQGRVIKSADAETFKSISEFYGVDKYHAFHADTLIPNSNGASFEVLNGNFSRDGRDYFFNERPLEVCDYKSFKIHDFNGAQGNWLSYDDKCAYYMKSKIPIEDRDSFTVLLGGYTKDKENVYFGNRVVEGADPASFEMIGSTFAGKDKYSCFNGFDRVECL